MYKHVFRNVQFIIANKCRSCCVQHTVQSTFPAKIIGQAKISHSSPLYQVTTSVSLHLSIICLSVWELQLKLQIEVESGLESVFISTVGIDGATAAAQLGSCFLSIRKMLTLDTRRSVIALLC